MPALGVVESDDELAPWRLKVRMTLFPFHSPLKPTVGRGWFENALLGFLILNCFTAAFYDPSDHECRTQRCEALRAIDILLTLVYLAEIAAHAIAFGISQLKQPLRMFDILVIIANIALFSSFYAGVPNTNVSLNVVRVSRLLRPIFTTVRFRAVRVLVVSVTRCLFQLTDVVLLYALFLMWFGVAGVYQFGGLLRTRCVADEYFNKTWMDTSPIPNDFNLTSKMDFVCGGRFDNIRQAVDLEDYSGATSVGQFCTPLQTCDRTPTTALKGYHCPYGYTCTDMENPYYGFVGFDNLAQSLLTAYTSVTFQLWYEAMFWAADSSDVLAYGYFVSLVIIGAYLIINLTIVIITVEFEKGKQLERDKIKELLAQTENQQGRASFAGIVQQLILEQKKKSLEYQQLHRPDMHLGKGSSPTKKREDDTADQEGDGQQQSKHREGEGDHAVVDISSRLTNEEEDENASVALINSSNNNGFSSEAGRKKKRKKDEQQALVAPNSSFYGKKKDGPGLREMSIRFIQETEDADDSDSDESTDNEEPMEDDGDAESKITEHGGSLKAWKIFLHDKIVETPVFNYFTVLVILANLVILCYDHYGMDKSTEDAFNICNIAFSIFFTLEALLRFLSRTPKVYIMDFHNVFDVFIVVLSWIEIIVPSIDFPIIRALRALRCIKLLKNYPSLYEWILFIGAATRTSPLLIILLLLLVFVFACVAMQIFGGVFCGMQPDESVFGADVCEGLPRANFDTFGQAMISSFQIVTADDWNFIMYDAMRARGAVYAVPFCIFFYLGNYVVLNLLIAILLSANTESDDFDEESGETNKIQAAKSSEEKRREEKEEKKAQERREVLALASGAMLTGGSGGANNKNGGEDGDFEDEDDDGEDPEPTVPPRTDHIDSFVADLLGRPKYLVFYDSSRIYAQRLMEHTFTEIFISIVIIVSSICMGLENPLAAPDTFFAQTLFYLDIGITAFYCLETFINCYGYGVISGYTSYLRRDHWNKFDFLLVIISIVGVSLQGVNVKGSSVIRNLKALRALRPLRLVRHSPGMKLVLSSLLGSMNQMRNVAVISLMIFGMWGIMGVFLFKGALRVCLVGDEYRPELPLSNCTALSGSYVNDGPNFDNIGAALVSLFQVATLEGWNAVMYRVMDTVGPEEPRKRDASPWAALYIIFMACFGGMFLVNLFVSVLIDSYNREKRSAAMQRSLRKAREEDGWLLTNKRIIRHLPHHHQRRIKNVDVASPLSPMVMTQPDVAVSSSPLTIAESTTKKETDGMGSLDDFAKSNTIQQAHTSAFRLKLRDVVRSRWFFFIVLSIVCLNFVTMAVEHYPQAEETTSALRTVNIVFTACFVAEAMLKIYAEGFTIYLQSKWNRLDFFVAIVSALGVALERIYNPKASALIRAVRVVRLARLARGRLEIDSLISKFGQALVSLVHVGAVIILVFFVFAVVGMKMFGLVKWGPFGETTGVDHHANFARLDNAILLLTRVMTGGNWGDLMDSCSLSEPFCDLHINDCGVSGWVSACYYVLFMVVSMFILKNLLTAVLLDSFASSGRNTALQKDDAHEFYVNWQLYDKADLLSIPAFDVLDLIRSLSPKSVLGFNHLPQRRRVNTELKFLAALQITDPHGRIDMETVVDVLCRFQFTHVRPPAKRLFIYEDREYEEGFTFQGTGLSGEDETPEEAYSRSASLILINSVVKRKRITRAERRKRREQQKARNVVQKAASAVLGVLGVVKQDVELSSTDSVVSPTDGKQGDVSSSTPQQQNVEEEENTHNNHGRGGSVDRGDQHQLDEADSLSDVEMAPIVKQSTATTDPPPPLPPQQPSSSALSTPPPPPPPDEDDEEEQLVVVAAPQHKKQINLDEDDDDDDEYYPPPSEPPPDEDEVEELVLPSSTPKRDRPATTTTTAKITPPSRKKKPQPQRPLTAEDLTDDDDDDALLPVTRGEKVKADQLEIDVYDI